MTGKKGPYVKRPIDKAAAAAVGRRGKEGGRERGKEGRRERGRGGEQMFEILGRPIYFT